MIETKQFQRISTLKLSSAESNVIVIKLLNLLILFWWQINIWKFITAIGNLKAIGNRQWTISKRRFYNYFQPKQIIKIGVLNVN